MVLFNYSTKEITAKIVYYGPGLCGKTTNLQFIYDNLPATINKGKMLSLATKTDRTLFFDFLPIDLGTIRGMRTRLQLYTVPGQVFYNTTRKLVLKGADGVVFVADSQKRMAEANQESFRNLEENLAEHGMNLAEMPLIIQFNKRDLPDVANIEELNASLNRFNAPIYEAVATTGIGVHETLRAATRLVLNSLKERYADKKEERLDAASQAAAAAAQKAAQRTAPPVARTAPAQPALAAPAALSMSAPAAAAPPTDPAMAVPADWAVKEEPGFGSALSQEEPESLPLDPGPASLSLDTDDPGVLSLEEDESETLTLEAEEETAAEEPVLELAGEEPLSFDLSDEETPLAVEEDEPAVRAIPVGTGGMDEPEPIDLGSIDDLPAWDAGQDAPDSGSAPPPEALGGPAAAPEGDPRAVSLDEDRPFHLDLTADTGLDDDASAPLDLDLDDAPSSIPAGGASGPAGHLFEESRDDPQGVPAEDSARVVAVRASAAGRQEINVPIQLAIGDKSIRFELRISLDLAAVPAAGGPGGEGLRR